MFFKTTVLILLIFNLIKSGSINNDFVEYTREKGGDFPSCMDNESGFGENGNDESKVRGNNIANQGANGQRKAKGKNNGLANLIHIIKNNKNEQRAVVANENNSDQLNVPDKSSALLPNLTPRPDNSSGLSDDSGCESDNLTINTSSAFKDKNIAKQDDEKITKLILADLSLNKTKQVRKTKNEDDVEVDAIILEEFSDLKISKKLRYEEIIRYIESNNYNGELTYEELFYIWIIKTHDQQFNFQDVNFQKFDDIKCLLKNAKKEKLEQISADFIHKYLLLSISKDVVEDINKNVENNVNTNNTQIGSKFENNQSPSQCSSSSDLFTKYGGKDAYYDANKCIINSKDSVENNEKKKNNEFFSIAPADIQCFVVETPNHANSCYINNIQDDQNLEKGSIDEKQIETGTKKEKEILDALTKEFTDKSEELCKNESLSQSNKISNKELSLNSLPNELTMNKSNDESLNSINLNIPSENNSLEQKNNTSKSSINPHTLQLITYSEIMNTHFFNKVKQYIISNSSENQINHIEVPLLANTYEHSYFDTLSDEEITNLLELNVTNSLTQIVALVNSTLQEQDVCYEYRGEKLPNFIFGDIFIFLNVLKNNYISQSKQYHDLLNERALNILIAYIKKISKGDLSLNIMNALDAERHSKWVVKYLLALRDYIKDIICDLDDYKDDYEFVNLDALSENNIGLNIEDIINNTQERNITDTDSLDVIPECGNDISAENTDNEDVDITYPITNKEKGNVGTETNDKLENEDYEDIPILYPYQGNEHIQESKEVNNNNEDDCNEVITIPYPGINVCLAETEGGNSVENEEISEKRDFVYNVKKCIDNKLAKLDENGNIKQKNLSFDANEINVANSVSEEKVLIGNEIVLGNNNYKGITEQELIECKESKNDNGSKTNDKQISFNELEPTVNDAIQIDTKANTVVFSPENQLNSFDPKAIDQIKNCINSGYCNNTGIIAPKQNDKQEISDSTAKNKFINKSFSLNDIINYLMNSNLTDDEKIAILNMRNQCEQKIIEKNNASIKSDKIEECTKNKITNKNINKENNLYMSSPKYNKYNSGHLPHKIITIKFTNSMNNIHSPVSVVYKEDLLKINFEVLDKINELEIVAFIVREVGFDDYLPIRLNLYDTEWDLIKMIQVGYVNGKSIFFEDLEKGNVVFRVVMNKEDVAKSKAVDGNKQKKVFRINPKYFSKKIFDVETNDNNQKINSVNSLAKNQNNFEAGNNILTNDSINSNINQNKPEIVTCNQISPTTQTNASLCKNNKMYSNQKTPDIVITHQPSTTTKTVNSINNNFSFNQNLPDIVTCHQPKPLAQINASSGLVNNSLLAQNLPDIVTSHHIPSSNGCNTLFYDAVTYSSNQNLPDKILQQNIQALPLQTTLSFENHHKFNTSSNQNNKEQQTNNLNKIDKRELKEKLNTKLKDCSNVLISSIRMFEDRLRVFIRKNLTLCNNAKIKGLADCYHQKTNILIKQFSEDSNTHVNELLSKINYEIKTNYKHPCLINRMYSLIENETNQFTRNAFCLVEDLEQDIEDEIYEVKKKEIKFFEKKYGKARNLTNKRREQILQEKRNENEKNKSRNDAQVSFMNMDEEITDNEINEQIERERFEQMERNRMGDEENRRNEEVERKMNANKEIEKERMEQQEIKRTIENDNSSNKENRNNFNINEDFVRERMEQIERNRMAEEENRKNEELEKMKNENNVNLNIPFNLTNNSNESINFNHLNEEDSYLEINTKKGIGLLLNPDKNNISKSVYNERKRIQELGNEAIKIIHRHNTDACLDIKNKLTTIINEFLTENNNDAVKLLLFSYGQRELTSVVSNIQNCQDELLRDIRERFNGNINDLEYKEFKNLFNVFIRHNVRCTSILIKKFFDIIRNKIFVELERLRNEYIENTSLNQGEVMTEHELVIIDEPDNTEENDSTRNDIIPPPPLFADSAANNRIDINNNIIQERQDNNGEFNNAINGYESNVINENEVRDGLELKTRGELIGFARSLCYPSRQENEDTVNDVMEYNPNDIGELVTYSDLPSNTNTEVDNNNNLHGNILQNERLQRTVNVPFIKLGNLSRRSNSSTLHSNILNDHPYFCDADDSGFNEQISDKFNETSTNVKLVQDIEDEDNNEIDGQMLSDDPNDNVRYLESDDNFKEIIRSYMCESTVKSKKERNDDKDKNISSNIEENAIESHDNDSSHNVDNMDFDVNDENKMENVDGEEELNYDPNNDVIYSDLPPDFGDKLFAQRYLSDTNENNKSDDNKNEKDGLSTSDEIYYDAESGNDDEFKFKKIDSNNKIYGFYDDKDKFVVETESGSITIKKSKNKIKQVFEKDTKNGQKRKVVLSDSNTILLDIKPKKQIESNVRIECVDDSCSKVSSNDPGPSTKSAAKPDNDNLYTKKTFYTKQASLTEPIFNTSSEDEIYKRVYSRQRSHPRFRSNETDNNFTRFVKGFFETLVCSGFESLLIFLTAVSVLTLFFMVGYIFRLQEGRIV